MTVMIRSAVDLLQMRPLPEMGGCWPKQARHTSQLDRLRMRGEEASLQWQRLQGLQDATACTA